MEFKGFVRSLARKGGNTVPEMCELLVMCLFCEDPEDMNDDGGGEKEFEVAAHEFATENDDILRTMFSLFDHDEDGMIQTAHARLLTAVATAKFDGETIRLTLDDMDQGKIDYTQFVSMIYRTISVFTAQQVVATEFLQCIHATLKQVMANGGFEELNVSAIGPGESGEARPRLRGLLAPLSLVGTAADSDLAATIENKNSNEQSGGDEAESPRRLSTSARMVTYDPWILTLLAPPTMLAPRVPPA